MQTGATKPVQIVFAIRVGSDRHMADEPGDGNIGLRPSEFEQRGFGQIVSARHAGGGGQNPVTANEVAALPDTFACKAYRLVIVAPDKVGVSGDTAKNCRERIARAQSHRSLRRHASLLPATAV